MIGKWSLMTTLFFSFLAYILRRMSKSKRLNKLTILPRQSGVRVSIKTKARKNWAQKQYSCVSCVHEHILFILIHHHPSPKKSHREKKKSPHTRCLFLYTNCTKRILYESSGPMSSLPLDSHCQRKKWYNQKTKYDMPYMHGPRENTPRWILLPSTPPPPHPPSNKNATYNRAQSVPQRP